MWWYFLCEYCDYIPNLAHILDSTNMCASEVCYRLLHGCSQYSDILHSSRIKLYLWLKVHAIYEAHCPPIVLYLSARGHTKYSVCECIVNHLFLRKTASWTIKPNLYGHFNGNIQVKVAHKVWQATYVLYRHEKLSPRVLLHLEGSFHDWLLCVAKSALWLYVMWHWYICTYIHMYICTT